MDVNKHFQLHPNANIPLFRYVEWHSGISIRVRMLTLSRAAMLH